MKHAASRLSLSSFLSRSLLVASVLAASSVAAHALGNNNGSPFSNGSFFPNDGTFQTTIRGKNLSGVATFSTYGNATGGGSSSGNQSSTDFPSSTGTFNVVYQGGSYSGNVDASMGTGSVAAALQGSITRLGNGTLTQTLGSSFEQTGTTEGLAAQEVVPLPDLVTTETTTSDNSTTTTTRVQSGRTETIFLGGSSVVPIFGWVDEVARTQFVDTLYCVGSFTAKLGNSFPNQIMKGKGTMEFTGINFNLNPPALETEDVAIYVKGVRISNGVFTYSDQSVQAPSVVTTVNPVVRRTSSSNATSN